MIHSHDIRTYASIPVKTSPGFTKIPVEEVPAEVFIVHIQKGAELPFHTSDYPILVYVLEGSGTFFTQEDSIPIQEGSLVECLAFIDHAVKPNEDTHVKLMVTKIKPQ